MINVLGRFRLLLLVSYVRADSRKHSSLCGPRANIDRQRKTFQTIWRCFKNAEDNSDGYLQHIEIHPHTSIYIYVYTHECTLLCRTRSLTFTGFRDLPSAVHPYLHFLLLPKVIHDLAHQHLWATGSTKAVHSRPSTNIFTVGNFLVFTGLGRRRAMTFSPFGRFPKILMTRAQVHCS